MIEVCFGSLELASDEAPAYLTNQGPSGLLLEYIAKQLSEFLTQPVFRDYSIHLNPGTRNPRGRMNVRGYVTGSAPRLKYDVMPCSYFLYSPDVPENQIIATTLLVMGRLAASLPAEPRRRVVEILARARPMLANVATPRITTAFFKALRYHSGNRRFKRAHDLCRIVLHGSTVSLTPGRRVSFSAFSLNMSDLFEQYVRALIVSAAGKAAYAPKSSLAFPIGQRKDGARLDGLLSLGKSRVVVECKYKVVEEGDGDFTETKISLDDMHQVVCYGAHTQVRATEGLLIYPTLSTDAPALQQVACVDNFRSGGNDMPIGVMLLSLRKKPSEVRAAFQEYFTQRYAVSV